MRMKRFNDQCQIGEKYNKIPGPLREDNIYEMPTSAGLKED